MIRVNKPETGNKYYININDGGVNDAKGNPKRLNRDLTSLPNCVAIYGWFNEIGQMGMQYLRKAYYPYSVIAQAKREGLTVTKEPTLGGIMVWKGGKTGDGHVAGVGQIIDDKHVLAVESEYYGQDWKTYKRYIGNGNWAVGCSWMEKSKIPYTYQGCIKNPFVDYKESEMSKEEIRKIVVETMKEEIPGMIREYLKELGKLPASWWAEGAIKRVKESKIMVGDPASEKYPEGNFRPQALMTREEAAVIINSFLPDR